jgi:uncharacterized protein YndB with AHSA1/START domain
MKLEPATIDLLDTADVVVTTEVDLPASIDEVWAVIADNTSWPEWFHNCAEMEASADVWTEAGQTRTIKTTPFVVEETSILIEAPTRWAMTLNRSNVPLATRMLEVLDLTDTSRNGEERTEVRWTGALDLPVYLRPVRRITESILVRTWGKSLEALHGAVMARR